MRVNEKTGARSSQPRLYLAHHVHCAQVEGQLVFLDLRADRYSCLAPEESDVVLSLAGRGRGHAGDPADAAEIAGALTEAEIFTADPAGGRPLAPPDKLPVSGDLMGYPVGRAPAVRAGHVARFLAAASTTAGRLRWRTLVDVVARVRDRKARRGPGGASALPGAHRASPAGSVSANDIPLVGPSGRPPPAELGELVEIYKRLRPLLFTSRDHCLYDSLALVEFLAAHGRFPIWVIGVRMGPFAAHSWVQEGGLVLNDEVAHAARFTPILTV